MAVHGLIPPFSRLFLTLGLSLSAWVGNLSAQSNWIPLTAGPHSWQTVTNWSTNPTIPNAVGGVANVSNNLGAAQTINLDGGVTLGTLNLGDTASTYYAYTIAAGTGGSLIFDNGSSNALLSRTTASTATDIISAGITLNSALDINAGSAGALTLSGVISGNKGFTKTGAGALELSNAGNSFVGTITVSAGTLRAATNDNVFGLLNRLEMVTGSTFNLNNTSQTFGSLNGAGTITFSIANAATRNLILGGDNLDAAFAGTITGTGSGAVSTIVKVGTGTQSIGGTQDNSSTRLQVDSGTVVLNKVSSIAASAAASSVTVNTGATLRLDGPAFSMLYRPSNYVDQIHSNTQLVLNGTALFDLNGRSENIDQIIGDGGLITNTAAGTESVLYIGVDTTGIGAAQINDGAGILHLVKTTIGFSGTHQSVPGGTTQTLTAASNFTGSYYANRGNLTLSGANGALTGVGAADKTIEGLMEPAQNVGITLERDSTLELNNATDANANRVRNDADVFFGAGAGTLRINGHTTTAINESVGDVTALTGSRANILIDHNGDNPNTGWTFSSLTRQAGSTIQIRTVDNLNAWSTGNTGGQAFVTLLDGGASLQKIGSGGVAGSTNRSIAQGVTIGVAGISDHFATVDGNNLRPLAASEYQSFRASAPTLFDQTYMVANPAGDRNANIIFDLAIATATNAISPTRITSSVAVNSLRLEGSSTITGINDRSRTLFLSPNSTLYLGGVTAGTDDDIPGIIAPGSGMILFGRTAPGTASGNQFITGGRLDFGSREAQLINFSGNSAYIRSVISGTGGLTKSGPTNVILDAANTYSGLTRVNEGVLYAFNGKSFGNSTQVMVEGSGGLYLGNGIEINGVDAIFTNRSSSTHLMRSDSGYSFWGGNLIIDNIDSLGYRAHDAYITVNTDRALSITGDIYGGSTIASNDTEMSSPRLLTTSGTSNGILNLRGVFSDKAGGVTATGNEVLHFQVTGANELNVNIAQAWKSNGRFMLRQGIVRYEGEGNFFGEGVTPNLIIKPLNTGANRIASFLLSKDGQSLNTGLTTVQIGDTSERQNTSDTTVMLGSDLMTGGTVTLGALNTTWDANPQNAAGLAAGNNRDIRFLAASGFDSTSGLETASTVIFNGRIIDDTGAADASEFTSLTKVGRGTLVFNGHNVSESDIDGGLNALAGSFVLNYTEAGTNRRHFGNNATGPQMTLAGGRVVMQGVATGGVTESFGVLNVARGGSEVVSLSGSNILSISASTLNRANGGTVNFVDTNATTGGEIRVGGTDNTLIGYWATFNSEDFAYRLGTTDTVGAPTSGFYSTDAFGTGINSVVTTSASATLARSLKITAGVTLTGSLTLEQGALLIPASNTAAVVLGATGDTLTTGGAAIDLIVHNYGSGGLTFNSTLTGSQALVISGTGVTTLTAASTGFTGKTAINGGTLSISADNQLGAVAAATPDQLYLNGGTLRTTANIPLDPNRGITLGGEGGTFEVAASTKLTYNGVLATEAFVPSAVTGAPPNLASGDLIKTGAGTLELGNMLNTYEGMTDVRAGTLRVAIGTGANLTPLGTNRSWYDATYVRSGAVLEFATTVVTGNDMTTSEWLSFEGGSTLRNAGTLPLFLNGVIELKAGRVHIHTSGSSGAQIYLNSSGGYITGSGDIYKTGDAYVLFMENNRDWTGNFYLLDGIGESRSAVNPFGTGTGVIEVGHNGAAHTALGYTSNGGTVQFQMYSDDSAATVTTLNRSILINEEGGGAAQTKRLGARNGDTGDVFQYGAAGNPDGHKITLNDDVQLYYISGRGTGVNSDPDFLTRVYIEYNADITNGTIGNKNISTAMDQDGTGNVTNGVDDVDNYAYFVLNGNNTGWIGSLTTGNGTTNDPDRNHIIRFGTSQAISASNNVAMGNQATLQMYGNDITIGNLSSTGAAGLMFIENNSSLADATLTVRQTSTQTVNMQFRDGVVLAKDGNDMDRKFSLTLDATADATKLVTTQNNTYTGKTTVNRGVLELSTVNGAINDSAWLQVNAQGTFANATTAAYRYDGIVTGSGKVTGNFIVGDNVGAIASQGVLKPGNSSLLNDIASAGDARGTLTFTGNLELAAPTSPAVSVVRAQLQIAGATGNVASAVTGDSSTWVATLPTTHASLVTGVAGDHDHLEIGGSLTVNDGSVIDVINFGNTYAPAYGDVFNLMDWVGALSNTANGFSAGTNLRSGGLGGGELNLPDISSGGFLWDVSLFTTHGVIVVVPEPSRILLLAFALAACLGRRRR